MTPAAPDDIASSDSAFIGANPAAETPTITGTSVRPTTRLMIEMDSAADNLPASPIMPRIVSPVAPFST